MPQTHIHIDVHMYDFSLRSTLLYHRRRLDSKTDEEHGLRKNHTKIWMATASMPFKNCASRIGVRVNSHTIPRLVDKNILTAQLEKIFNISRDASQRERRNSIDNNTNAKMARFYSYTRTNMCWCFAQFFFSSRLCQQPAMLQIHDAEEKRI